jgi:PIN domain nuclease of toxin-antitoxin system
VRLLLDTHIWLEIVQTTLQNRVSDFEQRLSGQDCEAHVSVCSLWEAAIKVRLGKLETGVPIDGLADYLESLGIGILPIDRRHAVTPVEPEPPTRDPFDHMLLAQCLVDDLQLVTVDRALADHPLAWRG